MVVILVLAAVFFEMANIAVKGTPRKGGPIFYYT
jgi:hypothetical protein